MSTTRDHEIQLHRQMVQKMTVQAELDSRKHDMKSVRRKLKEIIERIDADALPMTGWVAAIRKTADGWEPVGCYDSNNYPDPLPEFDMLLPIPAPEGVREWEGP